MEQAESIAPVLSISEKRFHTTEISFLTEDEIAALLRAPDRSTWAGRRDHAMLLVGVQTGSTASVQLAAFAAKISSSTASPG